MQLVPPAILAFALASSMPSTMIGVNALPVASPGAVRPTALRLAPSSAEASEIIKSLQAAEQKANEDPATGIEPLRAVLDQYEDLGPAVGRDAKAHEARIYALLALARAQQAVGQNAEAAQTMDEAIRVARGDTLPAKTFGPRLVELHESRRSAPENRPAGSIVVECNPACDVVLDARHAGSGSRVEVTDVPLGPHRVQVHANDGRSEGAVDEAIRLTEDASTFALTWPAEGESLPPIEPKGEIVEPPPADGGPRRLLPRWAGIVGVATGAAAMIAGGVLLAFHGRCPDGSDPSGPEPCINVLETRTPGIALLAVGGAVFTGFGVALIVGETRGRKRATTGAMLGYTLRF